MDGESAYHRVEDVYVSYVEDAVTFWGQSFNRIHDISQISESLAKVCPTMSPVFGVHNPDKVYGGMFSADKCWYRCRLQKQINDEQCAVTYIDYGNWEVLNRTSIVELPAELQMLPVAQKYRLWGLQLQTSSNIEQGIQFLTKLIGDKQISVLQKATFKDATIVVQVVLDDVDVGEEVAKKGFAERCKLSTSPNGVKETEEIPANNGKGRLLWPVRPIERLPMREPKSIPVFNRCILEHKTSDLKDNHGRNYFQATRLSSEANGIKSDQRCLDENKQLKEENKLLKDETKQLKDEKEGLLQNLRSLDVRFQNMQIEKELSEQTICELEQSLKSAAGSRLKALIAKIDILRTVRSGNENTSVPDNLLEAVKVVSEEQLSEPSTLKALEENWRDYNSVQEMIRACLDVVELDLLIDKRNNLQQTLTSKVDDFIVEVEQMPLNERLTKLQMLLRSLETQYEYSGNCEDSTTVFEEFYRWKQTQLLTFNMVRNDTDNSLRVISTWLSDIKELFDLASNISTTNSNDVDKIDSIMEKVDADISKELEVSLMELDEKEQKIIINAYFRVVKQIHEESSLIESIKSKYLSSIEFKKNIVEWINKNPNMDGLVAVQKTIKGLKTLLRWKLLECSSMEESDEYNETAHCELKNEIVLLRSKIFHEIQCEQEEYALLSDLVQKWFPELPLIYSDAGILKYMSSRGLLSSSMERALFDTEPMKELSSKRPLLHANVQGRNVLLKGYSVGVDTEEQVIVRAAWYHKTWIQQKEESGIMELLYLFFCKSDPMVYLMVPFYPRESLNYVQTTNPLNAYEIVKVMSGVADGLETLHESGIIIGSLHENNVFALNREKGVIGDFDFTKDADQRSSATSICFPLLTDPELKIGKAASTSSDVYAYGMILLWLCTGHKNDVLKPDGTPDLQRIDMNHKLKDLLSGLLCYENRMQAKQIKDHKYFLTAKAHLTPLPDENEEINESAPADFA